MIYLTDTLPSACPACGKQHTEQWKSANHDDFYAGASGECDCGAKYQHLPMPQLVEASKLNPYGDLHRYA
jgi:hypothetical protein